MDVLPLAHVPTLHIDVKTAAVTAHEEGETRLSAIAAVKQRTHAQRHPA